MLPNFVPLWINHWFFSNNPLSELCEVILRMLYLNNNETILLWILYWPQFIMQVTSHGYHGHLRPFQWVNHLPYEACLNCLHILFFFCSWTLDLNSVWFYPSRCIAPPQENPKLDEVWKCLLRKPYVEVLFTFCKVWQVYMMFVHKFPCVINEKQNFLALSPFY